MWSYQPLYQDRGPRLKGQLQMSYQGDQSNEYDELIVVRVFYFCILFI